MTPEYDCAGGIYLSDRTTCSRCHVRLRQEGSSLCGVCHDIVQKELRGADLDTAQASLGAFS